MALHTLYHGTSSFAAAEIRSCGFIHGDVYLSPRRAIAAEYAGVSGEVIAVSVDTDTTEFHIDRESYDGDCSIDDAIASGLNVFTRSDIAV